MTGTCYKCKKKVSMWNSYDIEHQAYCKECYKKYEKEKEEKSKKEALKEENSPDARINKILKLRGEDLTEEIAKKSKKLSGKEFDILAKKVSNYDYWRNFSKNFRWVWLGVVILPRFFWGVTRITGLIILLASIGLIIFWIPEYRKKTELVKELKRLKVF